MATTNLLQESANKSWLQMKASKVRHRKQPLPMERPIECPKSLINGPSAEQKSSNGDDQAKLVNISNYHPSSCKTQSRVETFSGCPLEATMGGQQTVATTNTASEQVRWWSDSCAEVDHKDKLMRCHRDQSMKADRPNIPRVIGHANHDCLSYENHGNGVADIRQLPTGRRQARNKPSDHPRPTNYHFLCTYLLTFSLALLFTWMPLVRIVGAYQLTNNQIANNSPPKFITSAPGQSSNSEIVVRVKEGPASIGKLIYTLKGEDPDDDPMTFGVLGTMASELLRVENVPGNQANVYLRKELDRETTESHQVVITLTDGKLGRGNWVS